MILDNNIICYEYYKNQYTPNEVIKSGAKEDDGAEDKYSFSSANSALLVLEEDIVNSDGFGLEKGFYNVASDPYLDFLIIFQSGKMKAKIPVADMKVIETVNPSQFKVQKMSYGKFQKQQQKEYRKYLNGVNPNDINVKSAQIHRLNEVNSWILIYTAGNLEFTGIIKF